MKLVLSGSGSLYPAHVGGVLALQDSGIEIEEVCGASGGAIVAALVAAGYKGKELRELVLDTLPGPNGLIDWSWRFWNDYGFIKGERILSRLRQVLPPTFADTTIPLHVVVVDLNQRIHRVYNTGDDPQMDLPLMVRASMSIPIVFKAVPLGQRLLIDGGVGANFPIDYFGPGQDVIGLRMVSTGPPHKVKDTKSFILAIVDTFLEANAREHIDDAMWARVCSLDIKGSGTNFKLSRNEAGRLIDQGYRKVIEWLGKDRQRGS